MNNTHINTTVYAQKVELLLRLMPIIMEEGVFAVHGVPNYSTCKLLCEYRGKQVKVEVNQTKRCSCAFPSASKRFV